MTESDIPGHSPADEAIDRLIDHFCDLCKSDIPTCPVNEDAAICPLDVIDRAEHEYYNGDEA